MTAKWRTATIGGEWRIEIDHHGHRLSLRRTAPGLYRAYLNGRMLGLWRSKETAMAAAEWAVVARNTRPPAESRSRSVPQVWKRA
jgi:hypothetical protein